MIASSTRKLFLFSFLSSLMLILSSNTVFAKVSDINAFKDVKLFVSSENDAISIVDTYDAVRVVDGEFVASENHFDEHKIGLFDIDSIYDKSEPILSRQKRRFHYRTPNINHRSHKPEFRYTESIPTIASQVYEYFDIISAIILAFFFGMPLNSYNVKNVLKRPAGPCIAIMCKFIIWPLVSHIYQCEKLKIRIFIQFIK